MPDTPPQRAAAYARLSYNPDGSLDSTDGQLQDIRRLAASHGISISAEYVDDDKSAWREGVWRDGWEAMLSALERGEHDAVLTVHGDRLARNDKDGARLRSLGKRHGLPVISTSGTVLDLSNADDRFTSRILDAVAIKSSDDTSRRVRNEMRKWRGRGNVEQPAYGWRRAGKYGVEPDPVEVAVIREIARRLLTGEAWVDILGSLRDRGVRTKRGQLIDPSMARKMLTAPRTAGLIVFNGETIGRFPGDAPLDETTWRNVKAHLEARATERRGPTRHLLTGLATCGRPNCGAAMNGSMHQRRSRKGVVIGSTARLVCFGPDGPGVSKCGNSITAAPVEQVVREYVLAMQANDEARRAIVGESAALDAARADAEAELARARKVGLGLFKRWEAGAIDDADYETHNRAIDERIARALREIDALAVADTASRVTARQLERNYDDASLSDKRAMIRAAVESIVILPSSRPTHGVDVSRIVVTPRRH